MCGEKDFQSSEGGFFLKHYIVLVMFLKIYFKMLRFFFLHCADVHVDRHVDFLQQKQQSCYLKSIHFDPLLKHSYASALKIHELSKLEDIPSILLPCGALTGKNDSLGAGDVLVSRSSISCSYNSDSSHPSARGNRLSRVVEETNATTSSYGCA